MAAERPPTTKRAIQLRLLLLLFSTLFSALLAEVILQGLCRTDADGNVELLGKTIRQSSLPINQIEQNLDRYLRSNDSRMIFDAMTGWKPRPNQCTHQQLYCYNAVGIRSAPQEYLLQLAEDVFRIALFGDSFTHGDDVPWEESWACLLEQQHRQRGMKAEVINFGVSAYGMDQAYLRWQQLGKRYRPQVVIFGFQAENINRNVNLLRGFYMPQTGIPFSKPRFVLEGDGLRLINAPTLPLDQITQTMQTMQNWPLAKHEWFYDPAHQSVAAWERFRLLLLIRNVFQQRGSNTEPHAVFELAAEPAQVTLRLLKLFEQDVQQIHAQFLIVHLPTKRDLMALGKNRPLPYDAILNEVRSQHHVVETATALNTAAEKTGLEALFQRQHYSAMGSNIIAAQIQQQLDAITIHGSQNPTQ